MIQLRKIFWMDVKSSSLTDMAWLCGALRGRHCVGDGLLENAGLFQMLDFLSVRK